MSLLCDIGNTRVHFYDGHRIWHEPHQRVEAYKDQEVYYINVNHSLKEKLAEYERWIDLEPYLDLESDYQGLGADRKALCMAVQDGVIVDAGSAITVDVMREGKHLGGFIYPGIAALREAYGKISPVLEQELVGVDLSVLPKNTAEAVSYGIIRPIVLTIRSLGEPIYLTGGDGALLGSYIDGAIYDELLVFRGLEKAKDGLC